MTKLILPPKRVLLPKDRPAQLKGGKSLSSISEHGTETVSVEYGITYQDAKGSWVKVNAQRTTSLREDETSRAAYDRAWDEVVEQVHNIMDIK